MLGWNEGEAVQGKEPLSWQTEGEKEGELLVEQRKKTNHPEL